MARFISYFYYKNQRIFLRVYERNGHQRYVFSCSTGSLFTDRRRQSPKVVFGKIHGQIPLEAQYNESR